MESTDLLFLFLGLFVIALQFSGGFVWRERLSTFGYDAFAWMALIANGAVRFSPLPDPFERFFGLLFGSLLFAGALSYAGRKVPKRAFGAVTMTGGGLVLAALLGFPVAARLMSTAFESALIFAAAIIVHSAANQNNRIFIDRMIAPVLVMVGLVDVLDHLYFESGREFGILPWVLVGIPLITLQTGSRVERLRALADEAGAALKRTVSELEATLEATTDGILVVDREGNHSCFNQRFGEMWQIPESILAQRDDEASLGNVMSTLKDPAAFYEGVRTLYAHPERASFNTLELNDGRVFERYSHPQRIGEEIVGRVWSFRDVTERRHAEAIAARYQDDLESLVEERTRELLESRDRLREADRMAAIGTLTAGVAHQINNPIGVILNSAEYALLCRDDSDAHSTFVKSLEDCVQEARRCGAIVRSMLQFARDEAVETTVHDLNEVVRRACGVTSAYARQRKVEFIVELFDAVLPVRMSAIEIEQVAVNVLRNAVESLDDGGQVRVRTDLANDMVRVLIADEGRGIEAKDRGRIFDPFYSTRLKEGGTGLGLSVAHGIVAQHDGQLFLANESGRGSEFVIELPLSEVSGE